MSISERIKKRPVTKVEYEVSTGGLHVRVNGFKEFTITKDTLLKVNGIVFEKEIQANENINLTPQQGQGENS